MDLINLLKLAGLAVQSPAANAEVEEDVPGKANTKPDPQIFPDGPSNLGSVSDTSLRRYLKARGQPVSVDETTYPDYSVDDVLESYEAYTAEKAKNPYAIGMASAMKTTGDKPPLKKSTINKAHKIAKGIDESSLNEANWRLDGGKTHMVGGNLSYDDKLEYLLSDEDADVINNFLAQADDDEKSKVWRMFWDHQEMGDQAEGPELAIQYAKDAMGMNENDEAMSGTYAAIEYDYSEDFGMITLYKNGEKIEDWNGYFGADTVGNPLADKFVELAMKHNLNPEGMSITDDTGATGTFGNNTFNWDQFAKDETGMNESINESYISELTRVLKNSGQLLNEAGGIGGGISGNKFGTMKGNYGLPNIAKSLGDIMPQFRQTPSSDNLMRQPTAPASGGIKGLERAPWSPGDSGAPGDVAIRKVKPNLPGGARPEGPAAGMPAAPDFGMKGRGLAPNTPRIGGKSATITPPVSRPNVGGARPEGPAAGMPAAPKPAIAARPEGPAAAMPKAPPQPASFKDAFRAARKEAGGAGGTFMWNGKPYQTNIKGEPAMKWNSPELKKVGNWSASESTNEAANPGNKSFEVHYTTSAGTDRVIKVNAASKKAAQDKVAGRNDFGSLHKIVEPKKTNEAAVNEAAKPDFLDIDKDGNKKEPMKKAVADKKKGAVKEASNPDFLDMGTAELMAKKNYGLGKQREFARDELARRGAAGEKWNWGSDAAKPDFLDIDKDGNKKEPMKKAVKDKEKVSESISYLKRLAGI